MLGEIKKVLTIAGSDCSGGAGIQADIKTITAHKMYAMSAITALTAQNTLRVSSCLNVPPEFVAEQLDRIFEDIRPDAVKIGMVSESGIIRVIAERLTRYGAKHIVVDPVMVSTSGCRLLNEDAQEALVTCLFPLAQVITPNIPEASVLSGLTISEERDMAQAARGIARDTSCAILIKGGHLSQDAADLLLDGGKEEWFSSERIDTPNTHGTGCTLSSSIACRLAAGYSLSDSVRLAKEYLTGALKAGLALGHGSGPLNHMYLL